MIDKQRLNELTQGDTLLYHQLVQQFVQSTQDDLAHLKKAIQDHNVGMIKHFSHRIKGSAQIMGVNEMIDLATILEGSTHILSKTALQEHYQQLHITFNSVVRYVNTT